MQVGFSPLVFHLNCTHFLHSIAPLPSESLPGDSFRLLRGLNTKGGASFLSAHPLRKRERKANWITRLWTVRARPHARRNTWTQGGGDAGVKTRPSFAQTPAPDPDHQIPRGGKITPVTSSSVEITEDVGGGAQCPSAGGGGFVRRHGPKSSGAAQSTNLSKKAKAK